MNTCTYERKTGAGLCVIVCVFYFKLFNNFKVTQFSNETPKYILAGFCPPVLEILNSAPASCYTSTLLGK